MCRICKIARVCRAKPTKPNLLNQTYQTKPNLLNQTHQTKPKQLVKVVNTWVRSAFGNVFLISFFGTLRKFSSCQPAIDQWSSSGHQMVAKKRCHQVASDCSGSGRKVVSLKTSLIYSAHPLIALSVCQKLYYHFLLFILLS